MLGEPKSLLTIKEPLRGRSLFRCNFNGKWEIMKKINKILDPSKQITIFFVKTEGLMIFSGVTEVKNWLKIG